MMSRVLLFNWSPVQPKSLRHFLDPHFRTHPVLFGPLSWGHFLCLHPTAGATAIFNLLHIFSAALGGLEREHDPTCRKVEH